MPQVPCGSHGPWSECLFAWRLSPPQQPGTGLPWTVAPAPGAGPGKRVGGSPPLGRPPPPGPDRSTGTEPQLPGASPGWAVSPPPAEYPPPWMPQVPCGSHGLWSVSLFAWGLSPPPQPETGSPWAPAPAPGAGPEKRAGGSPPLGRPPPPGPDRSAGAALPLPGPPPGRAAALPPVGIRFL